MSTSVHSGRFRVVVNNFDLSSSWFTTSNAFCASSVATIIVDFVRLASARASVMTRLAMLSDLPMVKPNCRSFPGRSCSIPSFMQMSSTILHKIGAMVMPRWLSWILGSLSFLGMGILYVLLVMSGSFLSVTIFCINSVSISMDLWGSSLTVQQQFPGDHQLCYYSVSGWPLPPRLLLPGLLWGPGCSRSSCTRRSGPCRHWYALGLITSDSIVPIRSVPNLHLWSSGHPQ